MSYRTSSEVRGISASIYWTSVLGATALATRLSIAGARYAKNRLATYAHSRRS